LAIANSVARFHAILARLVPASWTVTALLPGDRFLFGLADVLLAVVSSLVIASGTVAAALCDDILVFSRLEGFAIAPGFEGASWAGIAGAGDGGLGEGGGS
jgi:hypothetical protein